MNDRDRMRPELATAALSDATEPPRILLIDDEESIYNGLDPQLRRAGYHLNHALTGQEGLDLFRHTSPDVVLLDLGLPDIEGIEVCALIRSISYVSIIIYTIIDDEGTKRRAIAAGASAYLTKSAPTAELLATIRVALVQWSAATGDGNTIQKFMRVGIHIDPTRHTLTAHGRSASLSRKEYDVLSYLMRHVHTTVSGEMLLQAVWGADTANLTDVTASLRVFMSKLRQKIELDPYRPRFLFSVANFGYRLEIPTS